MLKIAPYLKPFTETVGAGLSKDNPAQLVQYRYPIGTVYGDTSSDYVYNLVKALDETFPLYEKAHPTMVWWRIDHAGVPPVDAPFHEGAIKYFKEKGIWTPEYQAWNDKYVKRIKNLEKAWAKAMTMGKAQKLESKDFEALWMKIRAEVSQD